TIATSLVSLISGRKVKPKVGMTGEITLRGQVLPIGGVKEKVIAAHRNGLRTVILPKRNETDLDDIPDEVKTSMKFIFVETVDEVLDSALEGNHKRSSPVDKRSGAHKAMDKSAGAKQAKRTPKKKTTPRKTKTNGKNSARGR
ncbi:MAG: S16 family serine protease, partial [Anaerolineales bacterium]